MMMQPDLISKNSIKNIISFVLFFIFFAISISPIAAQDLLTSVSVNKKRMTEEETVSLTITLKGIGVERIHLPELFPPSFVVVDKSDKPSLSQDAFGHPISGRVLRYQLQPTASGR